jgi:MFS family permease
MRPVTAPVPELPETASAWRRALGSVAVDIGLLRRRRDFGLLVLGQTVSEAGSMATFVAVPFQVYGLTGSSLAVGLLGVAEFAPIIVLALVGGALADAFDRRRLVQIAEVGAGMVAGALLVNATLAHPHVWVLYVCAALMAAFTAVRRPPLDALVPRLVERDELKAASALQFSFHNMASLAGPALAGVVIAAAGLTVTYAVDVASFAASLVVLTAMRTPPPPPDAEPPSLRTIVEGLRYARSRQDLVGTYLVDMNAMFFGMPMALFPAIAKGYGGAEVLGLLYAAPSAGSIAVTLTSGWTARVHRHGRAIVYGAAAWGVAIVAFGFAGVLWLALVCLVVAGAMDTISGIFRSAIWNETIPDHLRGRLAGVEMISWSSGPLLGDAEAGLLAALAGVRTSVVSGGIACVAGTVVLAFALPRFWGYDSRAHAAGADASVANVTDTHA